MVSKSCSFGLHLVSLVTTPFLLPEVGLARSALACHQMTFRHLIWVSGSGFQAWLGESWRRWSLGPTHPVARLNLPKGALKSFFPLSLSLSLAHSSSFHTWTSFALKFDKGGHVFVHKATLWICAHLDVDQLGILGALGPAACQRESAVEEGFFPIMFCWAMVLLVCLNRTTFASALLSQALKWLVHTGSPLRAPSHTIQRDPKLGSQRT